MHTNNFSKRFILLLRRRRPTRVTASAANDVNIIVGYEDIS